jgi:NAD(P)H-hydrate repair Nnr-like enzyme with NAD(P)H-hydrate dehydratase domain
VDADPVSAASEVAERSQVVVLVGGTCKHVVTPDGRCWVIEGGGPGLGVSGSGDVQAGIVSGLLARGAEPAQAAVWGGYLHARSGERLAGAVGVVGYLARELPAQVPAVLGELA